MNQSMSQFVIGVKLDEMILVDYAVPVTTVVCEVVKVADAALLVELRKHGQQALDTRDVGYVVVIVALQQAHHLKLGLGEPLYSSAPPPHTFRQPA